MSTESSNEMSARAQPLVRASGKVKYFLISLAVLALDQWSKWLVEMHLPLHTSNELISGLLSITHVRNTGVAFGLFAAGGNTYGVWILTALGIGALAFVAYYFSQVPASERLLLVALTLVFGGAVGNLLDRIATGGVTDFIDVFYRSHHWHTFNVADSAITIGIGLMLLATYRQGKAEALADALADAGEKTEAAPTASGT
jgi:signal peptidase II